MKSIIWRPNRYGGDITGTGGGTGAAAIGAGAAITGAVIAGEATGDPIATLFAQSGTVIALRQQSWHTNRKGTSMKILAASAFAIGLSLAAVSVSTAMPVAPLDRSVAADTIRVAGGCGPGWHRGPYGGCRPMYNCPPGWHSGPFGRRCFRNW
jgi:hypothetical protein